MDGSEPSSGNLARGSTRSAEAALSDLGALLESIPNEAREGVLNYLKKHGSGLARNAIQGAITGAPAGMGGALAGAAVGVGTHVAQQQAQQNNSRRFAHVPPPRKPLTRPPAQSLAPASSTSAPHVPTLRLLQLLDDPRLRNAIVAILQDRREGTSVPTAPNPRSTGTVATGDLLCALSHLAALTGAHVQERFGGHTGTFDGLAEHEEVNQFDMDAEVELILEQLYPSLGAAGRGWVNTGDGTGEAHYEAMLEAAIRRDFGPFDASEAPDEENDDWF